MFASDMRKIINSAELSDIQFVVGEEREKIWAHKVILAGRCEVFRAMFADSKQAAGVRTKGKESTMLVLPDVRPTVFLTVLEHIYTNSCKLSHTIVVDVLASAIEYGLDGLVKCCVEFISDPNVDTVCEAIQAAITYNQVELRDKCMAFIESNTRDIFKSPHFAELSEQTLAHIIQSDGLTVEEGEIYEAVKEWGTVNMVITEKSMKEVLCNVLQHVRFPMLSQEALKDVEAENAAEPGGEFVPEHLISRAWRYQATKQADPKEAVFRKRAGAS